MEKINIKQGAFGFGYRFVGVPDEWVQEEAEVWFSCWKPGDPTEIICQKECELILPSYWLQVEEGDFDADPGIYHYEIARYEDGVMLDPSFTGELEILESAGAPGGNDE
jgi:hypothetical protein